MTSADRTITALRRRTVLAAAVAMIGLAGAANAFAYGDPVDLKVVDRDTGQPLRVWRHHGRLFVAGQPGARYGLRVANHTNGRVMVVMSVDGINILTGETAGYGQNGYVFDPYESYDLNGWRKSNTEVAAFTFAPLPQSYAARTGRPNEVGVIGIAVFKEQRAVQVPEPEAPLSQPEWRDGPGRDSSDTEYDAARRALPPPPPALSIAPAPKAAPAAPSSGVAALTARRQDEKLGTAHGAREISVMNSVTFERATPYPQFTRQIEYDTYDNLVASGVIRPSWNTGHRPRPFPAQSDGAGFVPDPPNEP